jgi:hypothetical protein
VGMLRVAIGLPVLIRLALGCHSMLLFDRRLVEVHLFDDAGPSQARAIDQ